MKTLIKKIRIEDAKYITMLSAQMGYPITLKQTRNHIKEVIRNKDNCAFVALNKTEVIGWIHGFKTIRIESAPFIEIGGLVVDENYRRKGVGKLLVHKVKEWGIKQKNNSLRVRCNRQRLEAHKFYSNLNFRETKEQKIFQLEV